MGRDRPTSMRAPNRDRVVNGFNAGSARVGDIVRSRHSPSFADPVSQAATSAQVEDPRFSHWTSVMNHRMIFHRKLWEWCYTLEALDRADMLRPGRRALGFGVGTEALPAVLASRGVEVVATDQPSDQAGLWATSSQHAASLEALIRDDLCDRAEFDRLVSFQPVDMRSIPSDLRGFDALWSSCCFEHLGSPDAGLEFVLQAMDCLRPGGIAIHTTEYDVHNSRKIVDLGTVVFYRRRELTKLAHQLRQRGHQLECNFRLPRDHPNDLHEDSEPYSEVHMRVKVGSTAATSFGLIITKAE